VPQAQVSQDQTLTQVSQVSQASSFEPSKLAAAMSSSSSSSSSSPTAPSLLPAEPLPWRPNTRPKLPPGALLDIDQGPLYDIVTEYLEIEDICHLDSALCHKKRRAEFLALVSTKVLLFERIEIDVLEPFSVSSITPLGAAALIWILTRGIHLASLHLPECRNNNDDISMSITDQESIRESIASLAQDGRLDKLETISLGECTYINDADLLGILSKCHRSVKSINIRGCGLTESSASLVKNCTKLEAFAACGNESAPDLVSIFQSCRKKLRKVDLSAFSGRLTDEMVQSVAENCRLLEHLDVRCCFSVSDENVRKVAESCPLLQYVDFFGIDITDATMVALCNYCSLLKRIDVGYCDNLTDAAVLAVAERLPGLTYISLYGIPAITSNAVETLASKCRELEFIDVGDCPHVSNITLEKIAEYCSKLMVLNVTRCPKVTCAGLTMIATKCSKLHTVFADDRPEIMAESLEAVVSLEVLFPRVCWELLKVDEEEEEDEVDEEVDEE